MRLSFFLFLGGTFGAPDEWSGSVCPSTNMESVLSQAAAAAVDKLRLLTSLFLSPAPSLRQPIIRKCVPPGRYRWEKSVESLHLLFRGGGGGRSEAAARGSLARRLNPGGLVTATNNELKLAAQMPKSLLLLPIYSVSRSGEKCIEQEP